MIRQDVINEGFNTDAHKRLMFRLDWMAESLTKQRKFIACGNLASLEPELAWLNSAVEDLNDVVRELVSLLNSNFQKEQGLISPPNVDATTSETPAGS